MPSIDVIYRNPSRWRAVIHTQDVRHGTAGCLLSLVLFAPLFVRQLGMVTVATAVLAYGLIIVPALTNYFSPIKLIMKLTRRIFTLLRKAWSICSYEFAKTSALRVQESVSNFLDGFWTLIVLVLNIVSLPFHCFFDCLLSFLHGIYIALEGFRVTCNQIVFFILCEKLLAPEARLSSLHFLLFYTVLAYLHRSLVTRQWSRSFYETNIQNFLKLTTWFIAVRLAKGVAMAFVLIIFTMQCKHVEPNVAFIGVTFAYFVLTQKKWTGNERLVTWFRSLHIDALEEEEEYWIPFIVKAAPISASFGVVAMAASSHQNFVCLVALYTNILVPIQLMKNEFDERHVKQSISVLHFPKASKSDLEENPICPICLDSMRVARVTPCNHVYHAICIRKCLAISVLCPMCKRTLANSFS